MKHKPPLIIAPIAFLENRWLTHGLFWLVVIVVQAIGIYGQASMWLLTQTLIGETIFLAIFTYFILRFLVPNFLYQSRFFYFLTLATISIFIGSYIDSLSVKFLFKDIPNIDEINLFSSLPIYVLFFFMVTAIKLGKDLMILQYENSLEQSQKLQQELNFLKAQLSPHFLLNTMNNLYGLSVVKSNDLPPLMLRLSDLLRYTLYDTKGELVALKDEIQYLNDYIELQKIRLSPKVQLTVDFPTQIAENQTIAPLLLVVFVENAFKYCQINSNTKPSFVHLKMNIIANELQFIAVNSYEKNIENNEEWSARNDGGIGLKTTLRRIELLYGKDYMPTITTDNDQYKVVLNLKLANGKN